MKSLSSLTLAYRYAASTQLALPDIGAASRSTWQAIRGRERRAMLCYQHREQNIRSIPEELADGEYVRNGSNPVSNEDLGRDAHWFDGDGMLAGVSFNRDEDGKIKPHFVNQ
ncbi:hypothetical protein MRB53_041232 [Persea americana]|nr:hypothetical protein MRB53_041232 [Persea americana]